MIPRWLPPGLVVAVTLAAFLPTLGNGFASWDDAINFLDNPHYRGLGPARLRWMFTTFHTGHYIPLTWLSLGLDYLLGGLHPGGYHLTSLLLHTATALAFYFVSLRLLRLALLCYLKAVERVPAARPGGTSRSRGSSSRVGSMEGRGRSSRQRCVRIRRRGKLARESSGLADATERAGRRPRCVRDAARDAR